MARFENKNALERKHHHSDNYQFVIYETLCSNDFISSFSNEESISERLAAGFSYDERILELQDRLYEVFWREAEKVTTKQQWQIIKLIGEGFTQMEIGKKTY